MMNSTPRIVICDDDGPRAKQWAVDIRVIEEVRAGFAVHTPEDGPEFGRAVEALSERRLRARTTDAPTKTPSEDPAALFDGADILVLDYDLTPYPGGDDEPGRDGDMSLRGRSGESVAYLARCYSRCGFIVVVNQAFQGRTFDLTLQRFTDSYADLNITSDDLTRRELWLGEVTGDFRPWQWPRLIDMAETFRRRVENVDLGGRILDTLAFSEEERQALTPRQRDVLGDEPRTVTFEDLVEAPEVGLRVKDEQPSPEHRRRIAAGAVGRWLDGLVLPAQNILIDRPHLRQLYPQLFPAAAGGGDSPHNSSRDFDPDACPPGTRPLRQPARDWLSRYACSHLDAQQAALESTLPQADEVGVFCEDTSRFVPLDQAREVETDVPGPYVQRFVEKILGVDYRPLTRLFK